MAQSKKNYFLFVIDVLPNDLMEFLEFYVICTLLWFIDDFFLLDWMSQLEQWTVSGHWNFSGFNYVVLDEVNNFKAELRCYFFYEFGI